MLSRIRDIRWRNPFYRKGAHPVVGSATALTALLDAAPVVLLATDPRGTIVYRNEFAWQMNLRTAQAQGQGALVQLRDELARVVTTVRKFPHTQRFFVGEGGNQVHATLTVDAVPGGFIATWRNTTAEVEWARVTGELAEELAGAAGLLTALGEQLATSSDHASGRAATMANGAREMTLSIQEISNRVHEAAASTSTAVDQAQDATRSMGRLKESSSRIGNITQVIKAIAEQTKLLALNATIEAARAGESGRGFRVVASEVKDLAARSAEATERISPIVEAIEADCTEAATAIAGIVGLIEQIAGQQTMIAGAVEEQTAVTGDMSQGIESVVDQVRDAAATAGNLRVAATSINDQAARLRDLMATETGH